MTGGDKLTDLVEAMLARGLGLPDLVVEEVLWAHRSAELEGAWRSEKYATSGPDDLVGVLPLDVRYRAQPGDRPSRVATVLKARGHAGVGVTALPGWLEQAGVRLPRPLEEHPSLVEFSESGTREIALYRLAGHEQRLGRYVPARLGDQVDVEADRYLLLLERVEDAVLMDSADDLVGWDEHRVAAVLDALGEIHAVGLTERALLVSGPWPSRSDLDARDLELFDALCTVGHRSHPAVVTTEVARRWHELIATADRWWRPVPVAERTLVHDDCNPRNVCFRRDGRPLLYDWEMAMVDAPQRDTAELLTFALRPGWSEETVRSLVERHRLCLERATGCPMDPDLWWEGFRVQVRLEAVNRVGWQWLFATVMELGYLARITATVSALLDVVD